jgi:hypothetical protein
MQISHCREVGGTVIVVRGLIAHGALKTRVKPDLEECRTGLHALGMAYTTASADDLYIASVQFFPALQLTVVVVCGTAEYETQYLEPAVRMFTDHSTRGAPGMCPIEQIAIGCKCTMVLREAEWLALKDGPSIELTANLFLFPEHRDFHDANINVQTSMFVHQKKKNYSNI